MSAAEHGDGAPHVLLIHGRHYGSGDTRERAVADFHAQIAGATPAMRASMATRAHIVPVLEELASDVAQMRDADAVARSDIVRKAARSTNDEAEELQFLVFFDRPFGESWSSENDCTCDDRCPECRTFCSPSSSAVA